MQGRGRAARSHQPAQPSLPQDAMPRLSPLYIGAILVILLYLKMCVWIFYDRDSDYFLNYMFHGWGAALILLWKREWEKKSFGPCRVSSSMVSVEVSYHYSRVGTLESTIRRKSEHTYSLLGTLRTHQKIIFISIFFFFRAKP
jgi:hypothetical protein